VVSAYRVTGGRVQKTSMMYMLTTERVWGVVVRSCRCSLEEERKGVQMFVEMRKRAQRGRCKFDPRLSDWLTEPAYFNYSPTTYFHSHALVCAL
jgi:hypothetical protein